MVRIIIALLFCFPAVTFAQTYQQLSERAIECIEKDSLPQAEELLLQALKLEPKNAKNALLFSNLGLVQRRLGEFDKALESYSFALNFAPLAVPILLDRAAIYMEMGKTDPCLYGLLPGVGRGQAEQRSFVDACLYLCAPSRLSGCENRL